MYISTASLATAFFALASAAPTSVLEAGNLVERATGGVVTGSGLAWYNADLTAGTSGLSNPGNYTCFSGAASNFPAIGKWMNFNAAWTQQSGIMARYTQNTKQQLKYMHDAILSVSQAGKVDPRVILAVIIQESSGRVNVGCTNSTEGVHNCGLMQAYNSHAFDPSVPKKSITLMISEGTRGTKDGPGLAQDLNESKGQGNVYNALRIYNSGLAALDTSNLNSGNGATNTYVTDVANRLMGWDGSDSQGKQKACATPTNPTPTPTPSPSGTPPSQCGAGKYVAPPSMAADKTNQHCCGWYTVKSGDYCAKITQQYGISLNQFYKWNPEVASDCSNLMLNYQYCVSSDVAASA